MTESKGIRKKQVGVLVYGERKNERGRKKKPPKKRWRVNVYKDFLLAIYQTISHR